MKIMKKILQIALKGDFNADTNCKYCSKLNYLIDFCLIFNLEILVNANTYFDSTKTNLEQVFS